MGIDKIQNTGALDNQDIYGVEDPGDKLNKIRDAEINKLLCGDGGTNEEIFVGADVTDDINQMLDKMTSDNILNMLQNFTNKYGKNIEDVIASDKNIDKSQREKILSDINKCLYANTIWNKPDSKLNMGFSQNSAGDCFFISSLQAVLATAKGSELLDDIITDNKNGTYTVRFKGTDKEYTVTALEIIHNDKFTEGDTDVKILELAAAKHFLIGIKHGGYKGSALALLTGEKPAKNLIKYLFKFKMEKAEELREIVNNENNAVVAGITIFSFLKLDRNAPYAQFIVPQHEYSVARINDDYVYLRDPRFFDSNNIKDRNHYSFKMPIEDFRKVFSDIQYVSLD